MFNERYGGGRCPPFLNAQVVAVEVPGIQGPKGDPGDIGATPKLSVAALPLEAGSDPTVEISGPDESPTIVFGIPKGDKGDAGDNAPLATDQLQTYLNARGELNGYDS